MHPMPLRPLVVAVALLLAGRATLLGPAPRAAAGDDRHAGGHVYVLNNNLSGQNSITVYDREADGDLDVRGVTPIGGLGSVAAFADGTQGSLILARDEGERLFAVDAGSDQISVVNVDDGKLTLAGVFPSGGAGPVSLTTRDDRLYVLNAANERAQAANVAGFRVAADGTLAPIPGATRPLSAAHPNPAQVQLDPSGRYLLVTEKGTNLIDVYRVGSDGSLSGPTTVPSVGAIPFALAFRPTGRPGEFLVTDAAGGPGGTGAMTAYRLAGGAVRPLDGPVPDHQIAPCWLVITRDGRFAYTSNADSQTISGYRIGAGGGLVLLNADGATARTPADTFPLEEGLSRDSHFLYVLDSRLLLPTPGPATLSGFRIGRDGDLTPVIDPARYVLPLSAIGLASE
jgi:DNA-binding beta-propeller fold protein YncE